MQLQRQNDREAKSIDSIFAEKQEREEQIRQLEREIDEEKRAAENVVSSMEPAIMERYQALKEENSRIEKVPTHNIHALRLLLKIAAPFVCTKIK